MQFIWTQPGDGAGGGVCGEKGVEEEEKAKSDAMSDTEKKRVD